MNKINYIHIISASVIMIFIVAVVLLFVFFNTSPFFKLITKSPASPFYSKPEQTQSSTLLFCPSFQDYCKKGKSIAKNGSYIGFTGDTQTNYPLFAAFDGYAQFLEIKVPSRKNNDMIVAFNQIVLTDTKSEIQAHYYFRNGTSTRTGSVKKGDQLAILTGETMPEFEDSSFVFKVIRGLGKESYIVNLSQESFSR